jgi:phosphoglycolate phosphatase
MPVKLIIFDLDGTLVDTSADITNALNFAIKPYGLKPLTVEDTIGMVGEGITRLIEKLLGSENAELKPDVIKRFLDYYSEHLTDNSTVYPNVKQTLERLDNVAKAVISNKREALSKRLLEELNLAEYFNIIVGSDTVAEKKPSALPVLHVLSTLGVQAKEALMIGDSNYDIEAARKAGVKVVAVAYGYRDRSVLEEAEFIIDDISDLLPLLYEIKEMPDRRREKRYTIPRIHQQYIELKINIGGEYIPVTLLDFSEHGMKIKSPVPFDVDSLRECLISVPKSLTKAVALKIKIKYCSEHAGSFVSGAEILEVKDEVWFRVFRKVHDFILKRAGDVF